MSVIKGKMNMCLVATRWSLHTSWPGHHKVRRAREEEDDGASSSTPIVLILRLEGVQIPRSRRRVTVVFYFAFVRREVILIIVLVSAPLPMSPGFPPDLWPVGLPGTLSLGRSGRTEGPLSSLLTD